MEIGSRVSQAQYPETAELVSSVREIVRSVNPDYSALPARIADQMQFFCQPANCPPALDNPVFADLANVPTTLSTKDLVVAVEYNRTVKLYPLAALRSSRVVNDWIGATPIAVTYSPGTGALRVFMRMTGETATKLRFTGQLRFGNEVLYDLENGSLWQQYTGEALTPAAQAVLAVLPHSEMTLEAAKKKFRRRGLLLLLVRMKLRKSLETLFRWESRMSTAASVRKPRLPAWLSMVKPRLMSKRCWRNIQSLRMLSAATRL